MNSYQKYFSTCLLATATLLGGASPAWAQVSLGAASEFSVLGGTAVTCTNSVVTGDVGVSPGSAFTNTGCTIAGGTPPATNAAAAQARAAFDSAYAALQLRACTQTLTGNLAGLNLAPGVYCVDAASTTTDGTLTLSGPSNGTWIFKIGTLGTGALTGTNFSVVMAGGGQACNVTWSVAEAATMTTSAFKGNILAGAAITLTGGSLVGRALARSAVTMTGASVIDCDVVDAPHKRKHKHKHQQCDRDDDDDDKKGHGHKKGHGDKKDHRHSSPFGR